MFLGKLIEGVKGKIVARTKLVEEKKAERFKQKQYKRFFVKPDDFKEGMAVINVREGRRVYQTYMYESGEILPLKLEDASQFENGLAKVETRRGRICVIDKAGAMWDAYTEKLKRVNGNVVPVTEDSQEVKILRKLYKAPSEFKKLATKWFSDEMFIVSCVTQIEEGLKAKIDAGKVPSNFNEYVLKLKREIKEKIALEKEKVKIIEKRETDRKIERMNSERLLNEKKENEKRYLIKEFREI